MNRFTLCAETEMESIDLANFMLISSQYGSCFITGGGAPTLPERVFECKTCNRRFPSFQALGGHRASHKKVKTAVSAAGDHQSQVAVSPAAMRRAHECSVCGLEFSVGQALGGHMRRHRAAAVHGEADPVCKRAVRLDLNLTPAENEMVVDRFQDVIIGIEVVEKTVPALPLLCFR